MTIQNNPPCGPRPPWGFSCAQTPHADQTAPSRQSPADPNGPDAHRDSVLTILRIEGLRVVVYPNDHPPAHVHVIGKGWVVVVNLLGPEVREAIGCTQSDARRVLRLVDENRAALMEACERYHG